MRARTGVVLALMSLLCVLWTATAWGRSATFTVTYSGAGTLSSQTRAITSPQCGEVTETRTETTHFSWVTHYELPSLVFERRGMSGDTATAQAKQSPLADNHSTVTLSYTGCDPEMSDCSGESDPQPYHDADLDFPGAPLHARTRVTVDALGGFQGFTGKGFSGGWSFSSGSCAVQYNDQELLIPENDVPDELEASFPVKISTLAGLRPGHYFKVRIDPGHYAPAHPDTCSPDDGCLKDDFSWHGVVEVKRAG
jgi:hypothetical protein